MMYGIDYPIPCCEKCGTQRIFEFQILSSILHVLHVDDSINNQVVDTTNHKNDVSSSVYYQQGGMDWGNIAIYTCPKGCMQSVEEFCIIQNTVDGVTPPIGSQEAIINKLNGDIQHIHNDDDDMNDGDDDDHSAMDGNYIDLQTGYEDDDDDW
jgi:Programmed cell death protein 2, C-terminal putative domain